MLNFEYDANKSIKNKEKHNISFEEARLLWDDKNGIVVPANIIDNELRYALIATFKRKCYVAIFTLRDENYRIISVRRCRKTRRKTMQTITVKEFDEKFDKGEDISQYLDFSKSLKVKDFEKKMIKSKKINVDFPENILVLLDQEAQRIGVTRQSIIKVWIAERLKEEQKNQLAG